MHRRRLLPPLLRLFVVSACKDISLRILSFIKTKKTKKMTEIATVNLKNMGKWINNSSLLVKMDPFTLFWGVTEAISVIF